MSRPLQLSIIVPCYNEQDNLPELAERTVATLRELGEPFELVLVNDGSRDRTAEVIADQERRFPEVRGVHHERNRGMFAAWKTGAEHARGTWIGIIDADLQYQPEDLARLWRELQFRNVDIVQGYRSSLTRVRDVRYRLSRGLNSLLNALFGMDLKDNKSGFLITRKSVFESILRHRLKYAYFQSFIMVSAKAKGYSYAEIETVFEERLLGESFIQPFPVKVVVRSLFDLAKALVEFRLWAHRDLDLDDFLRRNPPGKSDEPLTGWRKLWMEVFFATMPLHHWMISYDVKPYYRALKRSQWLNPQQIRAYQEERLRKLIEHAYYNVSYYREAMNTRGLRPEDIRTLEDLKKLPLLTKDICRKRLYKGLLANRLDSRDLLRITTSGSTGEPFVCYADKSQLEYRWAATQRAAEWTGCRFGDRQVRLWHQTLGMTSLQAMKERLDAWFHRRTFIPAYAMKEGDLASVIALIRRRRPVLVDGYAESFNLLAQYVRERKLDCPNIRSVMSSAQMLPDESRQTMEEAFGCRVFDKYGSREFSGIAYECDAHDGHHVVAENYIVEILKDGRDALPGETGEVVITDLNNFSMPFLRYQIGDLAVAMDNTRPCSCGRGHPRIGRIEGRVQSIIVGTDKQLIPGTFFAHLLKDFDKAVRRYQVIQHRFGEIEMQIIKGSRFTEATMERILTILRDHLGKDMRIEVKYVDKIAMVRTGKHQAVIQKMRIDFQRGVYSES